MEKFGAFELLGYHADYYQDGKYLGSEKLSTPDREITGYHGRTYEVATRDIRIGKKMIKKGTKFYTELSPICGKVIGDIFKVRRPTLRTK